MIINQQISSDNVIDLKEYLLVLWAYKFLIIFMSTIGIFCSVIYVQNHNKIYLSNAIFKIASFDNPISDKNTDFLKSLSGFGVASVINLPIDKINGRVFMKLLDEKVNLKGDTFFNSYDPTLIEPYWKTLIKDTIGWKNEKHNEEEVIWQKISKVYSRNIKLDGTLDGSARISVKHVDSLRASEIANTIMQMILQAAEAENNQNITDQLNYLSKSLAGALDDLEKSQSKLKAFVIENGTLLLEDFTAGSVQLNILRENLARTNELYDAIKKIIFLINNKKTKYNDYLLLRKEFPVVDQVEFRRILGHNEIISSWSWPSEDTLDVVYSTLSERKARLISQIKASEIDTKRTSVLLTEYKKLKRDEKVAEATHTVLMEQVKAQTILAGYRPNNSEIFQYASPSIAPSGSSFTNTLLLGGLLGVFFGCCFSLILSIRKGVFYSKKSLIDFLSVNLNVKSDALKALKSRDIRSLKTIMHKKDYPALLELAISINKSHKKQIIITSLDNKFDPIELAKMLGAYMQSKNGKIAILDFAQKNIKNNNIIDQNKLGTFSLINKDENVSLLKPSDDSNFIELLAERDLQKNLNILSSEFELVILLSNGNTRNSLLRSLNYEQAFHLLLARTKYTKSKDLKYINSLLSVQGLLYD